MAKATFIKSARKPIYQHGLRVEYVSQKGKKQGQTISKIDRTQPKDETDAILINVGESYYTWGFMYGGTYYSKNQPKASQLTNNPFYQQYLGWQESIEEFSAETAEDIESFVENIKEEIESLRDELQERLDNMPYQLQEAPAGEILTERIEELDSLVSDFESIDCDYNEPDDDDLREAVAENDESGEIDVDEEGWGQKITEEQIEEQRSEKLQEWVEEKIEEIKEVSFNL